MKKTICIGFAILLTLLAIINTRAATFTVTRSDDRNATCNSGLDCSLREAVAAAKATTTDDIINFASGISIITLTNEIIIEAPAGNSSVTINGRGANIFTIDGGTGTNRIFTIKSAPVTIADVTLTGGNGTSVFDNGRGGGVYAIENICGGCTLTLNRVHITGNTATGDGGGMLIGGGGSNIIQNTTISNNFSGGSGGGLLYGTSSSMNIINSTITNNTATQIGGGIYVSGPMNLRSTTITNNTAGSFGGGIDTGASATGTQIFSNTIIAGNSPKEIRYGTGTIISEGNNLVGDSPGDSTDTGNNQINYQPSDIRDTPPILGPLNMYGGTIPTVPLMTGSPAINAGSNNNVQATDQRGSVRIVSGNADIGSFEYNIAISPPSPNLPNSSVGVFYTQTLITSRLDGNPSGQINFSVIEGTLPIGVTLSPNGVISGTPSTAGEYSFTVRGTDTDGMAGAKKYTIIVQCSYSLDSSSQSFSSAGGSGIVTLTTMPGCVWNSISDSSWITVTNNPPDPRSGSGTVTFTVQQNTGIARTGTITIAGQSFTINQSSGCSYSLSANNASFTSSGGTGSVNVTSGTGCIWTATSNDSWLTINSGNSGSGSGIVNFSVGNNTGSNRTGTMTIAGQIFTVMQTAPCAFTLSPTSTSFPSSGGSGSFNITANNVNCGWSASTNSSWISIVNGTSGTGNGSVSFTVQVNVSPTRTGSIDVNGQTFSITQSNGCNYTLSAASINIPASGGTGNFNINAGSGCAWTAASNSPWISVTSGSDGSGTGTVAFTVQRNINGNRTGTIITTSGQTYTINQAAAATPYRPNFDFDGDGKADVSVFRASENKWYILQSSDFTVVQKVFALAGDIAAPADYDGDGKTDVGIFRPSSGDWWYLSSINNAQIPVHWGQAGDIPRPADFDGDGKADFIVYRPSNSVWYRMGSTGAVSILAFGIAEDKPLIGDFDGDGKADFAIFRPSTGDWWYAASSAGGQFRAVHWGASGDIPVPSDYDGDGKTDFAVYRPSNGGWYIANSNNGSFTILAFGLSTDKPIAADYDGDGKADIAVFRPSTGTWYLMQTTAGFGALQFGVSTDVAIPNAFIPQ